MKSILPVLFLVTTVANAHEGGHGTPEDPISSLPKIRTSSGTTFGVEGMIQGDKLTLAFRNTDNEVVSPAKSGFQENGSAEISFRGATKPSKVALKMNGNFYEGTFEGQGEEPRIKVVLNERGKSGKKQTVFLENVEQMPTNEGIHSHPGGKPHSREKTHTH